MKLLDDVMLKFGAILPDGTRRYGKVTGINRQDVHVTWYGDYFFHAVNGDKRLKEWYDMGDLQVVSIPANISISELIYEGAKPYES